MSLRQSGFSGPKVKVQFQLVPEALRGSAGDDTFWQVLPEWHDTIEEADSVVISSHIW